MKRLMKIGDLKRLFSKRMGLQLGQSCGSSGVPLTGIFVPLSGKFQTVTELTLFQAKVRDAQGTSWLHEAWSQSARRKHILRNHLLWHVLTGRTEELELSRLILKSRGGEQQKMRAWSSSRENPARFM